MILDYKSRTKELSSNPLISCCEKTLRTYIKQLKKLNYVWADINDQHLFLLSSYKLASKYEVSKFCHKVLVVPSNISGKNLELNLKTLAIEENLNKQKFAITEKLRNQKYGTVSTENGKSNLDEKRDKKLTAYVRKDYVNILLAEQQRYLKCLRNLDFKSIDDSFFPFETLGRKGIAKILKRNHKSTGTNLMIKLKENGLIIKDDKFYIIMERNKSYDEYIRYRNMFNEAVLDYKFKFCIQYNPYKKQIQLRFPNLIGTSFA